MKSRKRRQAAFARPPQGARHARDVPGAHALLKLGNCISLNKSNYRDDGFSGAVTHKREIITLYLEGYLTPEIAIKTNHAAESVDRYIRDYHRVELLWKYGVRNLEEINQLTRLAPRVAQQYIDLLPEKIKKKEPKNPRLELLCLQN